MKTWGDFTRSVEKIKGDQWLDLVRQDVALKHKTNDEYCSPCPVCGGDDRFVVWADKGKFWCRGCEKQGDAIDYLTWSRGLDFNQARDLLFPGNGNAIRTTTTPKPIKATQSKPQLPIKKNYDYRDKNGKLVYRKIRFDTDVKRDRFSQRAVREDGSSVGSMDGVRLVLYNLPGILKADPSEPVFVCEGERDADTAIALGYLATTFPNQSGFEKHCKEWQIHEPLRLRKVIIICDSDETGRRYGEAKAQILAPIVGSLKKVDVAPNESDGPDFSEWCGDRDDNEIREELRRIIDATPEYNAELDSHPEGEITEPPSNNSPFSISKLISFNQLEQMEIEPPQMIVEKSQPEGLTLLVGPMKLGKTQWESQKALAIANGTKFLGQFEVVQGTVLFLALEDSFARFRDRIICQSQGRPCPGNAYFHNVWPRINRSKGKKELCGLDLIRSWIELHHDTARHITIDTLQKLRPHSRGQGQTIYERDYDDLGDLQRLAIDARIGITVVHHTNKMSSSDELDQISGSNALGGACDTIIKLKGQRGSNEAEMFCTGRDIPEFRGVIRRDPDSKTWQWVGESGEIKLTEARQEIWDAIRDAERPLSITDLASAVGKPYRSVQSTVNRMKAKGELLSAIQNRWQLPSPDAMEGI